MSQARICRMINEQREEKAVEESTRDMIKMFSLHVLEELNEVTRTFY
jgi:hypothetical protein